MRNRKYYWCDLTAIVPKRAKANKIAVSIAVSKAASMYSRGTCLCPTTHHVPTACKYNTRKTVPWEEEETIL